jgi:hypothetical protein
MECSSARTVQKGKPRTGRALQQRASNRVKGRMARVWPSVALLVGALALVWWGTHRTLGAPEKTSSANAISHKIAFDANVKASLGNAVVGTTTASVTSTRPRTAAEAEAKPAPAAKPDAGAGAKLAAGGKPDRGVQSTGSDPHTGTLVEGCRVCRDAATRATFTGKLNVTTRLVCQAFWHLRFTPVKGHEEDVTKMW